LRRIQVPPSSSFFDIIVAQSFGSNLTPVQCLYLFTCYCRPFLSREAVLVGVACVNCPS
jgi:hypothetical protein